MNSIVILAPNAAPDGEFYNPYHSADGRFTTKGGAGGGSRRAGVGR